MYLTSVIITTHTHTHNLQQIVYSNVVRTTHEEWFIRFFTMNDFCHCVTKTITPISDWLLLQDSSLVHGLIIAEVARTTCAYTGTLNGVRKRHRASNQIVTYTGRNTQYTQMTHSPKLTRSRWMTTTFRVPCVM